MKKIMLFILILLLIVLLTISSIKILEQRNEEKKQDIIFEEIQNIVHSEQFDREKVDENVAKVNELFKINSDIVGWIKIDNTNINYPVMQNLEQQDYYLRRNFYKEYSIYGTPYIPNECDINNSTNIIIYGHNMTNGKMFGELKKYEKEDFYRKHKIINFYTDKEKKSYEIAFVFKTVVYKENIFKYYNFINCNDEKEYEEFIETCENLSLYDTGVNINCFENLITLSTCEYSKPNGRLVIVAKEIMK